MKKDAALKKWAKELANSTAVNWLDETMKGRSQAFTVEDLEKGINEGKISVRESLIFALIVGVQWQEKFEEANK